MRENGEIDDDEYRTAANVYQVLESYLVFGELDVDEIRIDGKEIELSENDMLLIVTDGVTDTIGHYEMEKLFLDYEKLEDSLVCLKSLIMKNANDYFSFVIIDYFISERMLYGNYSCR